MSEQKNVLFAYPRLAIAYFLQFAIWGSWAGFALSGYAGNELKLPGSQIGWLFAAIPLGAIISPLFIAPIADRYFAAQKVVSVLHLIGGAALLAAGYVCQADLFADDALFYALMTLILLSGICYMPTIALVNNIVFKHSKEGSAPYVFVFGTFGWIVINLFIPAFLQGAKQPYFFYAGGICAVVLALYALTLPDTPAKGAPKEGEKTDALGLGALKLFKDPSFAIFVICVFLASIPACGFFFAFSGAYLGQFGYPGELSTLNQFSELFFMALLPMFIGLIGLKWVVVLGMAAWALRYWVFTIPSFECAVIALLLHGFCYSFLYVAAYMYADKKAPADLKNSVQGLMAFLLLGVGQTLGSLSYGWMSDLEQNKPKIIGMERVHSLSEDEIRENSSKYVLPEGIAENFWKDVKRKDIEKMPPWDDMKMANSAWKYLNLGKTVTDLLNSPKDGANTAANADLGTVLDKNQDNVIDAAEWEAAPDLIEIGGKTFQKEEFEKALREMSSNDEKSSNDSVISREKYLAAQAFNWQGILLPPAGYIAVFFVLFVLLGKDPDAKKTKEGE